jgi:hypothetical protein
MGVLYDALAGLAATHDQELRGGFQRYETTLESVLSPQQIRIYAAHIHHAGMIRIFEEMAPEELIDASPELNLIAAAVMADTNASMENRRVVALLNQRGEHDVAPDLGPPRNG